MKKHMYPYIAVAGTMGSGKTTAARLIAEKLHFHLLEENFGENAFLPRFYEDMPRWAFHSQTFFLMEKITQMMGTKDLLTKTPIIQDTPIEQDAFSYAKAQFRTNHMDLAEWRLYKKILSEFQPYLPKPDSIIWLDTSVSVIIDRIKSRGREYEQSIPDSYVALLDELNREWLSKHDGRVISISTDNLNIVRSTKAQDEFLHIVTKSVKIHSK